MTDRVPRHAPTAMRARLALSATVAVAILVVATVALSARSSHVPPMPRLGQAWIIVLENQPYDRIVGAAEAPYINELIAEHGLATDYHGLGRPSQPNYIAMVAGSKLGVTDNANHDLDAPNVFDQVEAAGRAWRVLAEDYPGDCFTGELSQAGPDSGGTYVRKHDPAISFRSISTDPVRCARISGLAALGDPPADLNIVIPNLCHSMHDCSIAVGDAFLADLVPRILGSPSWGPDDALIVTFDEGDRIPTIVVSDRAPPGLESGVRHDHYSLLRTLQDGWGLDCLAASCRANTLGELFAPGGR